MHGPCNKNYHVSVFYITYCLQTHFGKNHISTLCTHKEICQNDLQRWKTIEMEMNKKKKREQQWKLK